MPDPKTCAAKGLVPGTQEYEDCVSYKGAYAGKKKSASPVKGRARSPKPPAGGGGGY